MRILTALLFALSFTLSAQVRPPIKFGVISKDELKMTVYEKDSSAAAVILFDVGESTLTGLSSTYTRHTRVKILTEAGLNYANVVVKFYKGNIGFLRDFKAVSYNLVNGAVEETKVEGENKFKEEFVEGIQVARMAIPKVRVGSVIEYKYEIELLRYFELRDWEFQHLIPCKWSEYKTHVTQAAEYHVQFLGYLSPHINEEKQDYCGALNDEVRQCKYNYWAMANVPAFREEPFISSYKNYISTVKFSLASINLPRRLPQIIMSSWENLRFRYFEETFAYGKVKNTLFLQKKAEELTKGLTHPDDKLVAIFNYVKDNLEWTRFYSYGTTKDPKKIMEEKKGSSGDINLILLSMLRYAGLPADPLLISTRDHGIVRQEIPSGSQFNSVLVMSDYKGKKTIIDATNKLLPLEFLPSNCLNGLGYLALDNGFKWVEVMQTSKTRNSVDLNLTLDENGNMNGKYASSLTGYEGQSGRQTISKEGLKIHLGETFKGKEILLRDTTVENLDKVNEPLKQSYNVTIAGHSQKAGEVIYIDPIVFSKQASNPFVLEERVYPIDFIHPKETILTLRLKVPDGYAVDELPQSKMSILPEGGGKFVYGASQNDGLITITSQLIVNRVLFTVEEYPNLREFYNIVVAKHNEQIVLKKISK